jgi:hypothetical protein
VMAIAPTLGWFSFGFLVLSVANNMILSPYSALVPDFVPADQRGVASGWLGLMSMLGYLSGGLISYHMDATGLFGTYFALALVHALSMLITVYFTNEQPLLLLQSPSGLVYVCLRPRWCSRRSELPFATPSPYVRAVVVACRSPSRSVRTISVWCSSRVS